MKYSPILGEHSKDRKFKGEKRHLKYLRSIQCILNATHGVVGPKREFFEAAFGRNLKEFRKLLLMPDDYIIYRKKHENNGAAIWSNLYNLLPERQKEEFRDLVCENQFNNGTHSKYQEVNNLLSHYKRQRA